MSQEEKPTVEEALAGVFEKSKPRLAISGSVELSDKDKITGGGVDVVWNEQRPPPPLQEEPPR